MGLKGSALAAVGLGVALLAVPTSDCGPGLAALLRDPLPPPSSAAPALDEAEVSADTATVLAAQEELAAWRAPGPAPRAHPARSHAITVSRVSASEVRAAEHDVSVAEEDVTADQAELDRLLAAQEESSDPSAYDGQVSAAREELDQSVARLAEARRALAAARSQSTTVQVKTTSSPRPAPTVRATPGREALVQALNEARQVQATHLAARKHAVASWRAGLQAETARVSAYNARVRTCAGRSGVPVSVGFGLLALGAGALARRRLTSRR